MAEACAQALPGFEVANLGAGPVVPAPERPMILQVSEVAEGGLVQATVVGANPKAPISIIVGPPGGPACFAKWAGVCLDVDKTGIVKAASPKASAAGVWRGSFTLPAGFVEGDEVVFQALVGPGPNSYVSHAVHHTTLAAGTDTSVTPVNILVIIADDLGADMVGTYGYPGSQPTPALDALAADGILFRTAWATPECNPSRSAFQTGRHPRRIGATASGVYVKESPGGPSIIDNALDFTQLTIPEILAMSPQHDYESRHVGKWGMGFIDTTETGLWPMLHGYDTWSGLANNVRNPIMRWVPEPAVDYFLWEKWVEDVAVLEPVYQTTDTTDAAIDAMSTMAEPWFLDVSYQAPHAPYHVPPVGLNPYPLLKESDPIPEKFAAMVGSLDTEIGRLLASVPALTNDTLIVFLGDNGTPLVALDELVNLTPQSRSKGSVYDGGIHVPLLVAGPMIDAPGRESQALVSVVDLMPTFAELAGVDLSVLPGVLDETAPLALDGESLVTLLTDDAAVLDRTTLYAENTFPAGGGPYLEDQVTIRDAGYKLIRDRISGEEQFFDYTLSTVNEGPNLVECGMDATQQAAMDALVVALDARLAAMPYDAIPVVPVADHAGFDGFVFLEATTAVPCPP